MSYFSTKLNRLRYLARCTDHHSAIAFCMEMGYDPMMACYCVKP